MSGTQLILSTEEFTLYGRLIDNVTGITYRISSLLDESTSTLCLERACVDLKQMQGVTDESKIQSDLTIYKMYSISDKIYIQARSIDSLPGIAQLSYGSRRWHVKHTLNSLTCEKSEFVAQLTDWQNELRPNVWKNENGAIVATEVLKIDSAGKRRSILWLNKDLDLISREFLLAVWMSRLWAVFQKVSFRTSSYLTNLTLSRKVSKYQSYFTLSTQVMPEV